jgi:hypothetical protein
MRWPATARADFWKKLKSILLEREFEMAKYLLTNPHKILTRLVAANIVLDIIAVVFWTSFPATQWSIYRAGFLNCRNGSSFCRNVVCTNVIWASQKEKMGALSRNRHHRDSKSVWHLRVLSRTCQYSGSTINPRSKRSHTNLELDNNLFCLQRHKNSKRAHLTVISIINGMVAHP